MLCKHAAFYSGINKLHIGWYDVHPRSEWELHCLIYRYRHEGKCKVCSSNEPGSTCAGNAFLGLTLLMKWGSKFPICACVCLHLLASLVLS
jgi:hypothetical protein